MIDWIMYWQLVGEFADECKSTL